MFFSCLRFAAQTKTKAVKEKVKNKASGGGRCVQYKAVNVQTGCRVWSDEGIEYYPQGDWAFTERVTPNAYPD
jgi:hypothetical protein